MSEAQTEFHEILEMIRRGGDVSDSEMDAAAAYARNAQKESLGLLSALLSGYAALQAELAWKDRVIEDRNQRILSLSRLLAAANQSHGEPKPGAQ